MAAFRSSTSPPLRSPGVLQRIAVCYFVASGRRGVALVVGQSLACAALLVGYWYLMTMVPSPGGTRPEPRSRDEPRGPSRPARPHRPHVEADEDVGPRGDRSRRSAHRDDDARLLAGEWVRSGRRPFATTLGLLLAGLALTGLGVLWAEAVPAWLVFPVNKGIWTSSFVLLTGGLAAALFGLTYWVVDVAGIRRWAAPFVTYGKNAIAVFVGAGLLAKTLLAIKWAGANGVPKKPAARCSRRSARAGSRRTLRLSRGRWRSC